MCPRFLLFHYLLFVYALLGPPNSFSSLHPNQSVSQVKSFMSPFPWSRPPKHYKRYIKTNDNTTRHKTRQNQTLKRPCSNTGEHHIRQDQHREKAHNPLISEAGFKKGFALRVSPPGGGGMTRKLSRIIHYTVEATAGRGIVTYAATSRSLPRCSPFRPLSLSMTE